MWLKNLNIQTPCHYSKNFWAEVIKWCDKQGIKIANLSDKDTMLGIVRCDDKLFVNHILLLPNNTYIIVDKKVLYLQLEC